MPPTDSIGVLAGTGPGGTLASGLVRAAENLGLPMHFRRLVPERLALVPAPMIAWVRRSHFVTVAKQIPTGLMVLDPQVVVTRISADAFKAIWVRRGRSSSAVNPDHPCPLRPRASFTSTLRRSPHERISSLRHRAHTLS